MPGQRLIDRVERTRKKPMRILVLGMCRTGTTSISTALRKLGYTPHQMRDVLINPKEIVLWQEAINVTLLSPRDQSAAQRNLAPYGRPEFDKLLGEYDAVMDLPGCIFARELIDAYPDAKVLLTKRSYAAWEQSMRESIWCLDTWWLFTLCRYLNITQLAPLMRLVHSIFRVHNGNKYGGSAAQSAYEKHYSNVRSVVSKDRLLEIDADADGEAGWEPLCAFLGTQVPREEYPRLNEEKAMRRSLEGAWGGMVRYLGLMVLLPGLVTVAAVFCYVHADDLRMVRDEWVFKPLKLYLDG